MRILFAKRMNLKVSQSWGTYTFSFCFTYLLSCKIWMQKTLSCNNSSSDTFIYISHLARFLNDVCNFSLLFGTSINFHAFMDIKMKKLRRYCCYELRHFFNDHFTELLPIYTIQIWVFFKLEKSFNYLFLQLNYTVRAATISLIL